MFFSCCTCLQNAGQPESVNVLTDDDNHMSKHPTPAASEAAGGKRVWECGAPEISIHGVDDEQVPEMPNLESVWAKSFQSVRKRFFSSESFCIFMCLFISADTPIFQ